MTSKRSDVEIEILRLLRLRLVRREQGEAMLAELSELAEVVGKPTLEISRACSALEDEGCIQGAHALAGEPGYWITDHGMAVLRDLEREI